MIIKEMHITPIAISDPPLLNAAGLHAPYALRTIVELVTDGRVSGWSEIPGNEDTNKALEQVRPIIIGSDPFDLNKLSIRLTEEFGKDAEDRGQAPWDRRRLVHVYSALEVACLDIIGKETNRPMHDLLGGRVRDAVPFAAYLFYKYEGAGGEFGMNSDPDASGWDAVRQSAAVDPDGIVRQAQGMIAEFGFKSVKLKGGAFPPDQEVAAMKALRKALGPEIPLRLDPNAIWNVETAVTWAKELKDILEYYEDPVRGQEAMAEVRRRTGITMATNMCTTSFDDIPTSISLESEDVILSDHHFWGGLRASVELARICRVFGRGLSMHSNSHIGISLAAMTHLGSAVPNLTYALDTHYPWQREEIVTGGRFAFQDGSLVPPPGPGLGVEIDRNELKRLNALYRSCGLTSRNDEVEMQKINPDWTFMATRW